MFRKPDIFQVPYRRKKVLQVFFGIGSKVYKF